MTKSPSAAASRRARDDVPGLQIVGQRDRAEIMAERRAEPRRRRLHRADARQHLDVERAPRRLALSRSPRSTAAAIANTPGSPPETTRDVARPRAASAARARARSISTRLSLACRRWSGAQRQRVEIGPVADDVARLRQRRRRPQASSNPRGRGRGRRCRAGRALMAAVPCRARGSSRNRARRRRASRASGMTISLVHRAALDIDRAREQAERAQAPRAPWRDCGRAS